jgi:RNA polymerase sigma-70 factor, ECF subfamily
MTIEPLIRVRYGEPAADPDVVTDVHRRRGRELWGFGRRLGLTDEQASDAVQETLLRLWAALRRGDRVQSPDAWAFRTLYRLAMDEHRLRRRAAALVTRFSVGPRARVDADPSASADQLAVWTEVDRLPSRQRQVVYLRYRADLPYDEIGEVLGITPSAARSHATQAMATLRARMAMAGGR